MSTRRRSVPGRTGTDEVPSYGGSGVAGVRDTADPDMEDIYIPTDEEFVEKIQYKREAGVLTKWSWLDTDSDILRRTPMKVVCGVCTERTETVVVQAKEPGCSRWLWKPFAFFNPCGDLLILIGIILLSLGTEAMPHRRVRELPSDIFTDP